MNAIEDEENDLEHVERLARLVLQRIRELEVDFQIAYEADYRTRFPNEMEEVRILMVAQAVAKQEVKFLSDAMNVVGPVQSHIRFQVMRRVKEERAGTVRRNPHVVARRKSSAQIRREHQKLQRQAACRLERDEFKKQQVPVPPSHYKAKPIQQVFGDLLDEVDHER